MSGREGMRHCLTSCCRDSFSLEAYCQHFVAFYQRERWTKPVAAAVLQAYTWMCLISRDRRFKSSFQRRSGDNLFLRPWQAVLSWRGKGLLRSPVRPGVSTGPSQTHLLGALAEFHHPRFLQLYSCVHSTYR